jgi:cell wall-associated NlpC family hydrolase
VKPRTRPGHFQSRTRQLTSQACWKGLALLLAISGGRAVLRRAALPFLVALAVLVPLTAPAHAATATARTTVSAKAAHAAAVSRAARLAAHRAAVRAGKVRTIMRTASKLKGRPYVWGARGPRAFDCSGFTGYVLKHAGVSVPRTSGQQYAHSHHIAKRSMKPGDLVFFRSGRHVYHVALYAGHGRIWHARHPGAGVALTKISSRNWVAGRVL